MPERPPQTAGTPESSCHIQLVVSEPSFPGYSEHLGLLPNLNQILIYILTTVFQTDTYQVEGSCLCLALSFPSFDSVFGSQVNYKCG